MIGRNKLTLINDFSCLFPYKLAPNTIQHTYYEGTWADGIAYIPPGGIPGLWEMFLEKVPPDSQFPMHVWNTYYYRERGFVPDVYQEVEPGLVCSFKWPEPKLEQPPEPICCFHGEPRPKDVVKGIGWIKEHWRC